MISFKDTMELIPLVLFTFSRWLYTEGKSSYYIISAYDSSFIFLFLKLFLIRNIIKHITNNFNSMWYDVTSRYMT